MICGKTKSGFEYKIEKSVLDNMELVDAIAEMDENMTMISKVVRLILPADQRCALYDHLRTEKGNVPIMAVSEEVAEIFRNSGSAGKN